MKTTTSENYEASGLNNLLASGVMNWLTTIGITLGISLIAIALIVNIIVSNMTFSMESVAYLYRNNPVHWIILTSPFFLGVIFFFMSRVIYSRQESLENRALKEKKQFDLLESFISDLEAGKLETEIQDAFENKMVADKLHNFRDKLIQDNIAEEQRIWESQGLAEFADLLRSSNHVDELSEKVIRFLVKYVNLNQGSIFVLNDVSGENPMLDMKACYAFERKKFINKSIPVGEGLVGQCFLEKDTMILHEVPQDYIKITSGLGTATPSFIAIIPMKADDVVTGVIEVAGFKKLAKHQINFLERAANAFATVIKSAMTNEDIKRLLADSQQQTEELRTQEEEMRQNLEELNAIQEQLQRQLDENLKTKKNLEHREDVLSKTTILSESDLYGTITYVNSKFIEVSQYRPEELIGKGHNIVRHPDMPKEIFKLMWKTIKNGETFRGIVKNRKKDGSPYWVDATIVPIFDNGKIIKYIGARYHIKDEAIAQKMFDEQCLKLGIVPEPQLYN